MGVIKAILCGCIEQIEIESDFNSLPLLKIRMIIQTTKGSIELSKELFWDIPESRIKTILDDNPYWVVPRVFEYGSIEEITDVIEFYGTYKSTQVLVQMKNELKPMAKAMAHLYLNLELRDYDLQKHS